METMFITSCTLKVASPTWTAISLGNSCERILQQSSETRASNVADTIPATEHQQPVESNAKRHGHANGNQSKGEAPGEGEEEENERYQSLVLLIASVSSRLSISQPQFAQKQKETTELLFTSPTHSTSLPLPTGTHVPSRLGQRTSTSLEIAAVRSE